jgi:cytochrome oxidase assembly protein ShyY1
MPAIIDSAPDCIANIAGAKPADDSADFILQAAYEKCAGIMTFGPGTTYGDEGAGAATSYYVLTWIGIAFMVAVLVAWVLFENRQLVRHVARLGGANRASDIVE